MSITLIAAHNFAAAECRTSPYDALRHDVIRDANEMNVARERSSRLRPEWRHTAGKNSSFLSRVTPYGVNLGGIFIGY